MTSQKRDETEVTDLQLELKYGVTYNKKNYPVLQGLLMKGVSRIKPISFKF